MADMLESQAKSCQKKSGPSGATNAIPALTDNADEEVRAMAVEPYNIRFDGLIEEQSDNWRSIGELAKEFLPVEESLIDYDDNCEDDQ